MDAKIFWFTLNYFILSNFYSETGSFKVLDRFNIRNKLAKIRNNIFEEEQFVRNLIPEEEGWKAWNSLPKEKMLSKKASQIIRLVRKDELNPEKVTFSLYTKENPRGHKFTVSSVNKVVLQKKQGVKIVCHGWMGDLKSDIVEKLKDAYLETLDVSVIGVDWNTKAGDIVYHSSAQMTEPVGRLIAKVIDSLVANNNLTYEDFHFIGHSLGAHVGGFAGRNTQKLIGRITGLDPALPGFEFVEIAGGRLSKSNAHFVDVIHTCVYALGITFPLGKVDFYPNGGSPFQPGCTEVLMPDTVACSHNRAVRLYAESIKTGADFRAIKCENWVKFTKGLCPAEYTQMGERVDRNASGIYYLQTSGIAPFYMGINGTEYHAN